MNYRNASVGEGGGVVIRDTSRKKQFDRDLLVNFPELRKGRCKTSILPVLLEILEEIKSPLIRFLLPVLCRVDLSIPLRPLPLPHTQLHVGVFLN